MSATAGLYVAIYGNSIVRHWGLFIDGPTETTKTILHITNRSGSFVLEIRNSNARYARSLLELVYLCTVDVSKIDEINGCIDQEDETYIRNKGALKAKQQGLP
ncbi:uncharacterized protein BO97DRAFT_443232 [Aspergillus homomorphus CBS 101889]|uniref:Uncharacterized protein n=1 Tax=Aspergillus homomorphus (strain CBS 101889) TaxID=1450537 RepID=A0A395HXK2_ASPHC|nr:hypothetical protein BO97DRAFT_443232 [Aspergillus homomorphus CBS 101889]RAL12209.1 hypothetical protein BO97DRAFT_443232 [Aspergillus homomorphus CBS 101889]